MKTNNLKRAFLPIIALVLFAFTPLTTKNVNITDSTIIWKGYKVAGEHEGLISLKKGTLSFADQKLTGGTFEIDMKSITVTDLEGEYKDNLEGHLKSDDFFGVEKHPNASFVITNVVPKNNNYTVTGNLTIKGITHSQTFNMLVDKNTATANLKIDRSKYDVRYGSNSFFDDLKDKAIYDEFDLNVNLKF